MDFEQKRKLKKILYSKKVLFVLVVLLILVGKATWNVYEKVELSKANLEKATRELEKLKDRQTALVSQLDRLNTEQGIESEIRQKFRVKKEGEGIAIIIDDLKEDVSTSTPEQGLWDKLIGVFKSKDKK